MVRPQVWAPFGIQAAFFTQHRLDAAHGSTRTGGLASPHEAQPKELSKGALTLQPGFPNRCQGTLGYRSKLTGVLWDISIILRENTAILDILQTRTKLPAQSSSQFDP